MSGETPARYEIGCLSRTFSNQMRVTDDNMGHVMVIDFNDQVRLGINIGLDELASYETVQPNCMFQLALALARIAVEPCAESYKVEAAQAMMDLVRAKPNHNIVHLFRDKPEVGVALPKLREAG